MNSKFILLVEDNPDDELLIVRGLRKNQIWNDVEVVRDGVAALDFLFATEPCRGGGPSPLPGRVFPRLRLARVHGVPVLRPIPADKPTPGFPGVLINAPSAGEGIP